MMPFRAKWLEIHLDDLIIMIKEAEGNLLDDMALYRLSLAASKKAAKPGPILGILWGDRGQA